MQVHGVPSRIRRLVSALLTPALLAVDPAQAIRQHVTRRGSSLRMGPRTYDLRRYRSIVLVGAGKASAPMAGAMEDILGDRLAGGLVVVKYGHGARTRRVQVLEAGHPVPDRAGQVAAQKLLDRVSQLTSRDLLVVVLSGGASSLLPVPHPGLTLADKQRTTQLLLRSGASIREINAVRKHLSGIKGGRLVTATRATVASLILSDVIGDDLGSIGSGPTAPDATTFGDVRRILKQYRIWNALPSRVRGHLSRGAARRVPDTPGPGAAAFRRVHNHLVGNNRAAVEAAAAAARAAGLRVLLLTTSLTGEAAEAGRFFVALAREARASGFPVHPPACLLAGGELTVTVRGRGRGGRAQEFALAAAVELEEMPGVWIAGLGTDGTDGPTPAAGAVVGTDTLARARRAGLDPRAALADNNAYAFLQRAGGLIVTGPTRTNVNDLYLAVIR